MSKGKNYSLDRGVCLTFFPAALDRRMKFFIVSTASSHAAAAAAAVVVVVAVLVVVARVPTVND